MEHHISPRVGAVCAMLGAAGIFISNFTHPFPPADRMAMLQLIADEPNWPLIHFPVMFFAVAVLIGLVALADSLRSGAAGSLARIGRTVAQVGVPIMLVGVAIDGFAFKALADAWAAAAPAEQPLLLAAADAVILAETAILHVWVTFFLGVTFILYGLAVASSAAYPRWLGWLGVFGGLGCTIAGTAAFLRLPLPLPFPVPGTLILGWIFVIGFLMARRATRWKPGEAGAQLVSHAS